MCKFGESDRRCACFEGWSKVTKRDKAVGQGSRRSRQGTPPALCFTILYISSLLSGAVLSPKLALHKSRSTGLFSKGGCGCKTVPLLSITLFPPPRGHPVTIIHQGNNGIEQCPVANYIEHAVCNFYRLRPPWQRKSKRGRERFLGYKAKRSLSISHWFANLFNRGIWECASSDTATSYNVHIYSLAFLIPNPFTVLDQS